MKDVVCLYIMIGLILLIPLIFQVAFLLIQIHQFVLVCLQLDFLLQRNEIVIDGTLVVFGKSSLFREQSVITRNNLLEFIESLPSASMEIFSLRMVSLSCFTLAVCSFTWVFRSRSMVSSSLLMRQLLLLFMHIP